MLIWRLRTYPYPIFMIQTCLSFCICLSISLFCFLARFSSSASSLASPLMPQQPMADGNENRDFSKGRLIASAPTKDSELHAPWGLRAGLLVKRPQSMWGTLGWNKSILLRFWDCSTFWFLLLLLLFCCCCCYSGGGDSISYYEDSSLLDEFLKKKKNQFKTVFLVAGSHLQTACQLPEVYPKRYHKDILNL